jgi:hypothetical protein
MVPGLCSLIETYLNTFVKRKIEDRVKFVIFQLIEGHNSGTTKGILTKFYLDLYVAVKTLCNNTGGHYALYIYFS